jgi:hypothetical protein
MALIDIEDKPFAVECTVCKKRILANAPLEGVVYVIGDVHVGTCRDCLCALLDVLDIARERWG